MAYRKVEWVPSESSEDDAGGSDDEWLPENEGLANASSSDSRAEGAEDADAWTVLWSQMNINIWISLRAFKVC